MGAADIDHGAFSERLEGLPGIDALREAAAGADAYLVGGAVRDLLLGPTLASAGGHADLDVVVEGDIGEVAAALGGELREHDRFATATVRAGELTVDLATARAERYPRPGALPEVRPAPLVEDLARRDFTVNAIAVPLAGPPDPIDPHGGVDDLRAGLLRVLHAGSFADDPTRTLRAARYAARFGFELEGETAGLLREADLGTVSGERALAELRRIAAEPDPGPAFALVRDWGLMPEDVDTDGPKRASAVAELAAREPWAGFAARDLAIMLAIRPLLAQTRELAEADPASPSEASRIARAWDPIQLLVARASSGGEWLDRWAGEWRHVALEIDGEDLIAAGVPEGPAVGRGLEAALAAKLDGELSGREAELERALAAAREAG